MRGAIEGPAWLVAVALALGCASADAQFAEGQRAFTAGSWQQAADAFERFHKQRCPTSGADARCKQSQIAEGESLLRLGDVRNAFLTLERARGFEPQQGPLQARLELLQGQTQDAFVSRRARAAGEGSVNVRLENRLISDRFAPESVRIFLDLQPRRSTSACSTTRTRILRMHFA